MEQIGCIEMLARNGTIDGIYGLVHNDLFMFLCIRVSCDTLSFDHTEKSGELNDVSHP